MIVNQTEFTAALMDPALAVPDGLKDPDGRPAGRRFAVYRNNVAVSLTEALETAFPVIRKLVGDEFFRAMAGIYLRGYPPTSPLMMHYGAELPEFLAAFEPVQSLGYLPDVSRLELAIRSSYHAADAAPVAPEALQSIPADRLMDARLTLAPAVRLVRSEWPIYAIWAQNMRGGPAPQMQAESVLITRPDYDPVLAPVAPRDADFIAALLHGETLGDAIEQAGEPFDLAQALGLLIKNGAIAAVE